MELYLPPPPLTAGDCFHRRLAVCLFICLFVSTITLKVIGGFFYTTFGEQRDSGPQKS